MKSAHILALSLLAAAPARADVTPAGLFTDGAVLQRGRPIPVFGGADGGEAVTVRLGAGTARTVAAADGRWRIDLPPLPAGGPYTLTIRGKANTVTLKNILVGEVFLCSGQSNMGIPLVGAATGAAAIAKADDPRLHLFQVPNRPALTPQTRMAGGQWQASTPETARGFSAVAYFFGRDLRRALGVPVGLIESQWGGTPAQAWTSADALKTLPDFAPVVAAQTRFDPAAYPLALAAWYAKHDNGSAGGTWSAPALDVSDWKTMTIPQYWEAAHIPALAAFDGVVWFRKDFTLTRTQAAQPLSLHLNTVDDRDTTYVNGVKVGGLDDYAAVRTYSVPASALRSGRNVIAVRVLDTGGNGGIPGKAERMFLEGSAGKTPLAGTWSYKIGGTLPGDDPVPTPPGGDPNASDTLFNGMIAPLIPYGIKGAIWYQGESNTYDPVQYQTLLPAMITDWRTRWGEGAFPFLLVQIAPYMKIVSTPQESSWAAVREVQRQVARTVPHAGLAVITDVGDENLIHPTRKEAVGDRLALLARALAYDQDIEYSGPQFQSLAVDGARAVLHFTHARGLAAADGKPLTGFALAGADRRYVTADAVIAGDTVVVTSPAVSAPAAVRFGWADYPVVNLVNAAGLPASPFGTDPLPAKP